MANQRRWGIALGVAFLIAVLAFTLLSPTLNPEASTLPSDLGIVGRLFDGFEWQESLKSSDSLFFIGELDGVVVKIHAFLNMDSESAENYLNDKMFVINSLYREIHSPYPGALSNRIECADEFKPKQVEHFPFDYYLIYATDRFTYGACSWDLITYETVFYPLYCEENNILYQIELFVPVEDYSSRYEEFLNSITCTSSVSDNGQSVLYKNGEEWWPLAQNLAWIEEDDPYDYEYYLQRLHDAGVELVRVILVPWDLHEEWAALGEYDEARISELESLLDTAAELNMSVILALDIYGELRAESHDPREMLWDQNPYNVANGGILESPAEFFTSGVAREIYKERLETLVANVGDSDALYAWEFWNEVDLADGYDEQEVCDWHAEMSSYLKSIDTQQRYISTSLANFENGDCIWRLDDIDLVMVHYYGRDVVKRIPALYEGAAAYGKPVLLEEFGWGNSADVDNEDPLGEHLREAIVAARDAGFAAGPIIWWWDSYVEQNNLYLVYTSMD